MASDDKFEGAQKILGRIETEGPIEGETSIPRRRWRERGDGGIIGLRGQGNSSDSAQARRCRYYLFFDPSGCGLIDAMHFFYFFIIQQCWGNVCRRGGNGKHQRRSLGSILVWVKRRKQPQQPSLWCPEIQGGPV